MKKVLLVFVIFCPPALGVLFYYFTVRQFSECTNGRKRNRKCKRREPISKTFLDPIALSQNNIRFLQSRKNVISGRSLHQRPWRQMYGEFTMNLVEKKEPKNYVISNISYNHTRDSQMEQGSKRIIAEGSIIISLMRTLKVWDFTKGFPTTPVSILAAGGGLLITPS